MRCSLHGILTGDAYEVVTVDHCRCEGSVMGSLRRMRPMGDGEREHFCPQTAARPLIAERARGTDCQAAGRLRFRIPDIDTFRNHEVADDVDESA
jgi:hypothetical protein